MPGQVVFDQVWKRFRRGLSNDSLRDLIPSLVRQLGRGAAQRRLELRESDFWAIRDVSFEVNPGQALGIIGGNGAGKSTVLKLLTRILVPTRGTAIIRGRAGALIEVSAGFHPDLTGRENVFLQGAIMGMPQQLIRERFDAIVEFSGIPAFIDTPVKRYSSGMNARLGFSIAAHLEPEVLIIDEVLSVGDAQFQTRAFERIKGLVTAGIPVVIVSHQLDRIVELCTKCIVLRQGQLVFDGEPDAAVQAYLQGTELTGDDGASAAGLGMRLTALSLPEPRPVQSGETFSFRVSGEVIDVARLPHVELGIAILDAASNHTMSRVVFSAVGAQPTQPGPFQVEFRMQANMQPGLYRLDTFVWDQQHEVTRQGPTCNLRVTLATPFRGTNQLNPVATLAR
jgi:ABC-type polysaccharide/polyol phosphate transport system ATPase subunit